MKRENPSMAQRSPPRGKNARDCFQLLIAAPTVRDFAPESFAMMTAPTLMRCLGNLRCSAQRLRFLRRAAAVLISIAPGNNELARTNSLNSDAARCLVP